MAPRLRSAVVHLSLVGMVGVAALSAGPSRYGRSDRVERHLLPEVTTGPAEPAWSPDGRWLAFSMRGDIWKVQASGGEAVALTHGPAYHFEPAWSPDGRQIALSMDLDANLDIGVVSADGGDTRRLTTDAAIDVEPAWSADGLRLYFASTRRGNFDLFGLNLADGAVTPVVEGRGDQIQPAVSPDGLRLAFVSPVEGRLGTGGIWTKRLPDGGPTLVHYEESEYRMRPRWTADGQTLLFGSDEAGSTDIAVVPADGGNPVLLTADPMGEFSPVPGPDGSRLAFVSNRSGALTLFVAPLAGGPSSEWSEVRLTGRRYSVPTGRVHVRIDGPDERSIPARVYTKASDGRAYTPAGGFHRLIAASGTHYFQTTGEFEMDVPTGSFEVEVMRGFEYRPAAGRVEVTADGIAELTIRLERVVDAPRRRWYSGDTHVHDLHQGRRGLTHRAFFNQLQSEDLHVTNALVHMDGTRLMGRWDDLTGTPHELSTRDHILRYGEEFRGSLGHIGMIGIQRYVLPLIAGTPSTAYAQPSLDDAYVDGARKQGGLAGFMHPYLRGGSEPSAWSGSLIPVDVARGRGDFYDVATLYSDELTSVEMYYRLLNCGFRLPATAGSDNFSDVFLDPPPGADRTYVRVQGPFNYDSWLAGIRAGRTFGTTGPLVFLEVDGRDPGEEILVAADAPAVHDVEVEVVSISPVDRLEIVANGQVVETVTASGDRTRLEFSGKVPLPSGGWIGARVIGPGSRYVSDSYAFAQTSPVYVVRDRTPFVSATDAQFLAQVVDAIWVKVQDGPWRSESEREAFRRAIDEARATYARLAEPVERDAPAVWPR